MSVKSTRQVLKKYVGSDHSDTSMMAEDAVFVIMATGEQHRGREAVAGMLDHFYRTAFDATAKMRLMLYGDDSAMFEGHFVGRHIGDFAGIPATGKEVCVPLCVVYDLEDDRIKHGRVYLEMPVLFQQLGVEMGAGGEAA